MEEKWIYKTNKDNTARFVLGIEGKNPLLILSINPSIGAPDVDTPTLGTVRHVTEAYGYDSWIIMCLYPQRATHLNELDIEANPEWMKENLEAIKEVMSKYPDKNLWACWGTRIHDRFYFPTALEQIVPIAEEYHEKWLHYGPLTEHGDPRYDLYVEDDEGFYPFDIKAYLKQFED